MRSEGGVQYIQNRIHLQNVQISITPSLFLTSMVTHTTISTSWQFVLPGCCPCGVSGCPHWRVDQSTKHRAAICRVNPSCILDFTKICTMISFAIVYVCIYLYVCIWIVMDHLPYLHWIMITIMYYTIDIYFQSHSPLCCSQLDRDGGTEPCQVIASFKVPLFFLSSFIGITLVWTMPNATIWGFKKKKKWKRNIYCCKSSLAALH